MELQNKGQASSMSALDMARAEWEKATDELNEIYNKAHKKAGDDYREDMEICKPFFQAKMAFRATEKASEKAHKAYKNYLNEYHKGHKR